MTTKKFDPTFYHRRTQDFRDSLRGDVVNVIATLQEIADTKINPSISIEHGYYDSPDDIELVWYEPMTDEQVAKKKARLKADKEARQARLARQKLVKEAKKIEDFEKAVELLKTDPELLKSIIDNLKE